MKSGEGWKGRYVHLDIKFSSPTPLCVGFQLKLKKNQKIKIDKIKIIFWYFVIFSPILGEFNPRCNLFTGI